MAIGITNDRNVNSALIEAPATLKSYLMCTFAAFGGIFFGYDTGWVGGVLATPYYIRLLTGKQYPSDVFGSDTTSAAYLSYLTDFVLPSRDQSLITSILSAGTFFGALISSDVADYMGRRFSIILGSLIFTIGCIIQVSSTTLAVMVVGRLIAGFGIGFISAIVIVYISEIAPRQVRGVIVAIYEFAITVGILLANCVVYSCQDRNDSGSYRIPISIQFLWAIILAMGLFFLPESPRYFVRKGRPHDAMKALASVRTQPLDSPIIAAELAEIIANYEYEKGIAGHVSYIGSWTSCFSGSITDGASNVRRTVLGIVIQMLTQFTGINFIFYFGTVFFKSLGTISNPFLITLITSLVNVLTVPISFYTIEKFGRRDSLLWGAIGMGGAQILVGIIGATAGKTSNDNNSATSAMIAFICISIVFFAVTWGPAGWALVGEIFPLTIRSHGIAMSTAANWMANCVSTVSSPNPVR
jgi:sugar porter (SP) family MFS transporter